MDKKSPKIICMEDEQVILRPINVETDLDIAMQINNVEVNQFLQLRPPITVTQEKEHLSNIGKSLNDTSFAIVDKKTDKFIGIVSLHRIDWVNRHATTGTVIFDKSHWSKGYGYHAKMLINQFAFHTLGLNRLNSSTIAFNKRSAACLLKCGYREEGVKRRSIFRFGKFHDEIIFGILRPEFEAVWKRHMQEQKEVKK